VKKFIIFGSRQVPSFRNNSLPSLKPFKVAHGEGDGGDSICNPIKIMMELSKPAGLQCRAGLNLGLW
jgi:hypothetical protein